MRAIGIILAGGNSELKLGDLTATRASAALPVGGCYRVIDFPLSNMSNSRINKVAVITQYNSRSLHDHLTSSKWWGFGRKTGGLFVFAPFISRENSSWFQGTADSIYQNISFLKKSNEEFVVIASGDSVYKMDYKEIIRYHKQKDADITVVCKNMSGNDLTKYGIMEMDQDARILEFEEKPIEPQSDMASLGIYVIARTLLIELLEEICSEGRYDFVKDIIIRYRKKLKIYGYEFEGYWHSVSVGVNEYFNCNMDFLRKDIRDMFFRGDDMVYTKVKDEPPVKYNIGSEAIGIIAGSGSIINGRVEHSVLFRRVYTGENSTVKNSIIMEGSYIGNNCVIENAIIDKQVVISEGKHVIGEAGNPVVIKKNMVV